MKHVICPRCKTEHGISEEIYVLAKERNEEMSVYCPNGHSWHFPKGESAEDKLRRERDLLKQRLAQKDDQISSLHFQKTNIERSLVATKGHLTRTRKRISHGVCLECNRTFGNLARHMQSEHPLFIAEAAE